MKKIILFGLAFGFGFVATAQNQIYVQHKPVPVISTTVNKAVVFNRNLITGYETNSDQVNQTKNSKQPKIGNGLYYKKAGTETVIGETTYDLQSNACVQNRIMNNGNGTISASWTYSKSYDIAAADRGTGYNFYNGTSWGALPTSRIESEKTGWPNIASTGSGAEVFVCHNIAQAKLTLGKRNAIGTGAWTLAPSSTDDQVWNRMTTGGTNKESIHHISLHDPFGGPIFGVQSQLMYYRSLDAGATWDMQEYVIPGIDSSRFAFMSGDSYTMAVARGDTLAFVYFGSVSDVVLAKSTDNGTTWTVTTILDFPINKYDPDGPVIFTDTLAGSDGTGYVLIDNQGLVHVVFGDMFYTDDTPSDGSWSYFPGTNGLSYWNENFATQGAKPIDIAGALDLDGDGTLNGILDIAGYGGASLSSHPSMGISSNGCIYVSYSAIMETLSNGTQNYRHIYVIRSCDGGCTWTAPYDVTPGSGFEECQFASMANLVDNNINIVYQRDQEPGMSVQGDEDVPYVLNSIVHLSIPVTDFDTIAPGSCLSGVYGDTMFCAGDSVMLSAACGTSYLWSTGETTQSIYYKGAFGPVTVAITTVCGVYQESINVAAPISAPVVNITATKTEMCNGDQSVLTATSNAGGSFSWSTGATTPVITVDSTGTYTVTVTNCGGTTVKAITLNLPVSVAAISGNAAFCQSDSITLMAATQSEPSTVYYWSTGDTAQSVSVSTAGAVMLYVTNCSGIIDSASVTTSFISAPTVTVNLNGDTTFCDNGGVSSLSLTAFAGGTLPFTYLWSNGSTAQMISLSAVANSGDYFVTVKNQCGDSVVSATTTVTIHPSPVADTVSVINASAFGATDGSINATVSGGTLPYAYLWSDLSNQTTEDATGLGMGNYTLTVTDFNGCTASTSAFVDQPVGIYELNAGSFSVHPNPSNGLFFVELKSENKGQFQLEIRNIIGQLVYSETLNGNSTDQLKVDFTEQEKGVYLMTISNTAGKRTEKLVIY